MSEFIGGRIIPVHGGVWEKSSSYEALTIVLYKATGDSYISRKAVPAGTAITDTSYWMLHSLYSQQIADAVEEMEETDAALRKELSDTESRMENRVSAAETLTNNNKSELNERMDGLDARLDANVTASTDTDADYAAEVVDAREGLNGERFDSLGAAMRSFSAPYTFRERVAVTGNNVPLTGKGEYTEAGMEYIKDSDGTNRAVAYTATILKDYNESSIMAKTAVTAAVFKEKFLGNKMVIQLFSPVAGYMNFSVGHGSSGGEGELGDHDGSPLQSDGTLLLNSISYNLYVGGRVQ